ncbi:YjbE family integral membrane protein [Humitalea rosea]|uniref:YjbE family integral membrane protein n=1 Tax=Humitalea rosea TaxID=990373 RepID=A0A2W7I3C5_9PROT|nr:YjbE family integral membrane protein [Humitalea rosea]
MDLAAYMPELIALGQVLLIDIVLAGDNAIVVGMAAAGLPTDQRRKAILWGIGAATIMRIGFATITVQLLAIVGITLAGGVLLLWVCWKMYRELRASAHEADAAEAGGTIAEPPRKTMRQAVTQILVADISMSLDNVLAVAGAAKDHPYILIFGLAISVVLMGVAASLIARILERFSWVAWIGLLVILYVAGAMIFEGTHEVADAVPGAYAYLLLPLGFLASPGTFPAWLWVGATLAQFVVLTALGTAISTAVKDAMRAPARHD